MPQPAQLPSARRAKFNPSHATTCSAAFSQTSKVQPFTCHNLLSCLQPDEQSSTLHMPQPAQLPSARRAKFNPSHATTCSAAFSQTSKVQPFTCHNLLSCLQPDEQSSTLHMPQPAQLPSARRAKFNPSHATTCSAAFSQTSKVPTLHMPQPAQLPSARRAKFNPSHATTCSAAFSQTSKVQPFTCHNLLSCLQPDEQSSTLHMPQPAQLPSARRAKFNPSHATTCSAAFSQTSKVQPFTCHNLLSCLQPDEQSSTLHMPQPAQLPSARRAKFNPSHATTCSAAFSQTSKVQPFTCHNLLSCLQSDEQSSTLHMPQPAQLPSARRAKFNPSHATTCSAAFSQTSKVQPFTCHNLLSCLQSDEQSSTLHMPQPAQLPSARRAKFNPSHATTCSAAFSQTSKVQPFTCHNLLSCLQPDEQSSTLHMPQPAQLPSARRAKFNPSHATTCSAAFSQTSKVQPFTCHNLLSCLQPDEQSSTLHMPQPAQLPSARRAKFNPSHATTCSAAFSQTSKVQPFTCHNLLSCLQPAEQSSTLHMPQPAQLPSARRAKFNPSHATTCSAAFSQTSKVQPFTCHNLLSCLQPDEQSSTLHMPQPAQLPSARRAKFNPSHATTCSAAFSQTSKVQPFTCHNQHSCLQPDEQSSTLHMPQPAQLPSARRAKFNPSHATTCSAAFSQTSKVQPFTCQVQPCNSCLQPDEQSSTLHMPQPAQLPSARRAKFNPSHATTCSAAFSQTSKVQPFTTTMHSCLQPDEQSSTLHMPQPAQLPSARRAKFNPSHATTCSAAFSQTSKVQPFTCHNLLSCLQPDEQSSTLHMPQPAQLPSARRAKFNPSHATTCSAAFSQTSKVQPFTCHNLLSCLQPDEQSSTLHMPQPAQLPSARRAKSNPSHATTSTAAFSQASKVQPFTCHNLLSCLQPDEQSSTLHMPQPAQLPSADEQSSTLHMPQPAQLPSARRAKFNPSHATTCSAAFSQTSKVQPFTCHNLLSCLQPDEQSSTLHVPQPAQLPSARRQAKFNPSHATTCSAAFSQTSKVQPFTCHNLLSCLQPDEQSSTLHMPQPAQLPSARRAKFNPSHATTCSAAFSQTSKVQPFTCHNLLSCLQPDEQSSTLHMPQPAQLPSARRAKFNPSHATTCSAAFSQTSKVQPFTCHNLLSCLQPDEQSSTLHMPQPAQLPSVRRAKFNPSHATTCSAAFSQTSKVQPFTCHNLLSCLQPDEQSSTLHMPQPAQLPSARRAKFNPSHATTCSAAFSQTSKVQPFTCHNQHSCLQPDEQSSTLHMPQPAQLPSARRAKFNPSHATTCSAAFSQTSKVQPFTCHNLLSCLQPDEQSSTLHMPQPAQLPSARRAKFNPSHATTCSAAFSQTSKVQPFTCHNLLSCLQPDEQSSTLHMPQPAQLPSARRAKFNPSHATTSTAAFSQTSKVQPFTCHNLLSCLQPDEQSSTLHMPQPAQLPSARRAKFNPSHATTCSAAFSQTSKVQPFTCHNLLSCLQPDEQSSTLHMPQPAQLPSARRAKFNPSHATTSTAAFSQPRAKFNPSHATTCSAAFSQTSKVQPFTCHNLLSCLQPDEQSSTLHMPQPAQLPSARRAKSNPSHATTCSAAFSQTSKVQPFTCHNLLSCLQPDEQSSTLHMPQPAQLPSARRAKSNPSHATTCISCLQPDEQSSTLHMPQPAQLPSARRAKFNPSHATTCSAAFSQTSKVQPFTCHNLLSCLQPDEQSSTLHMPQPAQLPSVRRAKFNPSHATTCSSPSKVQPFTCHNLLSCLQPDEQSSTLHMPQPAQLPSARRAKFNPSHATTCSAAFSQTSKVQPFTCHNLLSCLQPDEQSSTLHMPQPASAAFSQTSKVQPFTCHNLLSCLQHRVEQSSTLHMPQPAQLPSARRAKFNPSHATTCSAAFSQTSKVQPFTCHNLLSCLQPDEQSSTLHMPQPAQLPLVRQAKFNPSRATTCSAAFSQTSKVQPFTCHNLLSCLQPDEQSSTLHMPQPAQLPSVRRAKFNPSHATTCSAAFSQTSKSSTLHMPQPAQLPSARRAKFNPSHATTCSAAFSQTSKVQPFTCHNLLSCLQPDEQSSTLHMPQPAQLPSARRAKFNPSHATTSTAAFSQTSKVQPFTCHNLLSCLQPDEQSSTLHMPQPAQLPSARRAKFNPSHATTCSAAFSQTSKVQPFTCHNLLSCLQPDEQSSTLHMPQPAQLPSARRAKFNPSHATTCSAAFSQTSKVQPFTCHNLLSSARRAKFNPSHATTCSAAAFSQTSKVQPFTCHNLLSCLQPDEQSSTLHMPQPAQLPSARRAKFNPSHATTCSAAFSQPSKVQPFTCHNLLSCLQPDEQSSTLHMPQPAQLPSARRAKFNPSHATTSTAAFSQASKVQPFTCHNLLSCLQPDEQSSTLHVPQPAQLPSARRAKFNPSRATTCSAAFSQTSKVQPFTCHNLSQASKVQPFTCHNLLSCL